MVIKYIEILKNKGGFGIGVRGSVRIGVFVRIGMCFFLYFQGGAYSKS